MWAPATGSKVPNSLYMPSDSCLMFASPPGPLAAATLLEVLGGGALVDVIAHRATEHIDGLGLGCGQQRRLVDRGVRPRHRRSPGRAGV